MNPSDTAPRTPPPPDTTTDPPSPNAPQVGGAALAQQEGLPPDAVILVPPAHVTPTRQPEGTWALLVLAADIPNTATATTTGNVALFAGCWLPGQPPAATHQDDLVVVLRTPAPRAPDDQVPDDLVDVEMLIAHGDRWHQVGRWERLGTIWPGVIAVTAAAIMGQHTNATDTAPTRSGSAAGRLRGHGGRGGVVDLLNAGLLHPGELLHWDRSRTGIRHIARISTAGTLVLADGRSYANPSAALSALGVPNTSGWRHWRRDTDGRSLGDLRAELRADLGLDGDPAQ